MEFLEPKFSHDPKLNKIFFRSFPAPFVNFPKKSCIAYIDIPKNTVADFLLLLVKLTSSVNFMLNKYMVTL